ncbi:50S ribosomal protein L15 [Candidatus Roizmanbacteria bacterium CG2_30_33_16]|uniref:Large ribosomal subunit protein uL15 n=5 Tax=Candidatus Roizmaniibacteriota TaxID=1752723 RepID=A0A2M7E5N1_9BACT|nr:50S ribosomal protein L15 [Candidatus Roizmanbacteria bacterium]OIP82538.1 MAG: 50S ribosomal protein L15 [Candidatus Roizmanbacteria bacterium CG2_30_33_16]PIP64584.1 MAG: 50S ribosomal protein L15 [Candidatus Roizmanbacteria bacterium CG22_combo_CG10-13_8_21_14_all_33_16]PIV63042.1 MAG: 50S ribosomal protein L15 [Candidatus Roizmanbacteria bacterium CG01_land_8_20_14_3_00_33_9]PIX72323.1 MAG: 50S ribosomal protein L15 [Candidatus Roizmanbacteria bacterium CG_4_10_14_3_um_filter_33_21]PJB8
MEVTNLSSLPKIIGKKTKRIGRGLGSGRGAKSGRGTTRHQKARENIPLHFEGGQGRMVKRFPLLRGKGRNQGRQHPIAIDIKRLNIFENGSTVDIDALVKSDIIRKGEVKRGVKIVGNGKLIKKLTVKLPVSQGGSKLINVAGGTCIKL